MKNISKSLMLTCTLIACGLAETLYAPPARGGGARGGGFHGGGGRGIHRTTGTSRIRSSGRVRPSNISRTGTRRIGGYNRYYGGGRGRYYHGGYGRRWGHRYPYRYGLYPWGMFLLTEPWWRRYNWDDYYIMYPDIQGEVDALRAELAQNVQEMRQKDRRLAALEDRLDEALGENAQAGLKKKIAQLKHELRKQAEVTNELDARLKQKIGKS